MNQELYNEAVRSGLLSRKTNRNPSGNHGVQQHFFFINWSIDVLKIIKNQTDRGDRITDEVSGITYTTETFHDFVTKNFSSYIESQVFAAPNKKRKGLFHLGVLRGRLQSSYGRFLQKQNLRVDFQSQRTFFPLSR